MDYFVFLVHLGLLNVHTGLATSYHPGDKMSGSTKADGTSFVKGENHVAHRHLPLGTRGYLCNKRTSKCVRTTVRDRGPFGALRACRYGKPSPYRVGKFVFHARKIKWRGKCVWWQAQPRRLQPGFRYRGEFDVARVPAKAIGLRAFDSVVFYGVRRWKKPKSQNVLLVCASLLERNRTVFSVD